MQAEDYMQYVEILQVLPQKKIISSDVWQDQELSALTCEIFGETKVIKSGSNDIAAGNDSFKSDLLGKLIQAEL